MVCKHRGSNSVITIVENFFWQTRGSFQLIRIYPYSRLVHEKLIPKFCTPDCRSPITKIGLLEIHARLTRLASLFVGNNYLISIIERGAGIPRKIIIENTDAFFPFFLMSSTSRSASFVGLTVLIWFSFFQLRYCRFQFYFWDLQM